MTTPLLAMEISNNELMMGLVTVISLLAGLFWKFRDVEKSLRTGDKVTLNQPVEIDLKERAMTHKDHEALCGPMGQRVSVLEGDVREIRSQMKSDKREIIKAGDDRVASLKDEINDLRHDVNSAPARTVALLRDTKGLIP